VVAALPDGPALLDFMGRQPDAAEVILLDLYLPGADGVQTLGQLRRQFPQVRARVLMLTTIGRAAEIQRALAAGADGFVLKDTTGDELASAVRGVHGGVTTLSTSAAEVLWPRRQATEGTGPGPDRNPLDSPAGRVASLTPREREILDLLAEGLANQDIARSLRLAERTVKTHVSSVLAKLGVTSRTQAALLARDLSGVRR